MNLPARLENKIERIPESGCWIWMGAMRHGKYGCTSVNNRTQYAHRVVFELVRGRIPNGMQLDHLCRVRSSVNPDHLQPVTCQENLVRGETFNRVNTLKTHCKRGHAFDAQNMYQGPGRIHRQCRTCAKERRRLH